MKSHVDRIFRELERENERISAYLRLVVVVALAALFVSWDWPESHRVSLIGLLAYAGAAVVAIVLGHYRVFRPWLPWVFVTLDMGIVFLILIDSRQGLGMSMIGVLSLPTSFLIFVILAHAAMRHRPTLVIYAAALAVVFWIGSQFVPASELAAQSGGMRGRGPMMGAAGGAMAVSRESIRVLLILLAALILAITVARTKRRVMDSIIAERRAANLSRYLPRQLAGDLAYEGAASIHDSRRQLAAVLFADIRGFTSLSETVDPGELAGFLAEFRRRVSKEIAMQRGVIDKFIGDAVMAVFGVPDPGPDDARNALRAAIAILHAIDGWNEERATAGLPPVGIGIGLHHGEVLAGVIGDEERLEYTVIGDTVNTAERLEELTRRIDGDLVVSAALLEAADEAPDEDRWVALAPQKLKGRAQPAAVYQWRRNTAAAA
jgi:adenylate cyclase